MERRLYEHLSQPYFDQILSGIKLFEGRPNKPDKFMLDDIITWWNDDIIYRKFTTRTVGVRTFSTFKDAIENVGLDRILPSQVGKTTEEAIEAVYRQWYTPEKEKEFGVILLELVLIEES